MSGTAPAGTSPAGTGPAAAGGAAASQSAKLIGAGSVLELGRALMAIMAPATGTRSTGMVRLQALTGVEVTLPRNHYAFPIIKRDRRPQRLFKVGAGPNLDGSWTITDSPSEILMVSNIGGKRHNLKAGTPIVFDPPIEGLVVSPDPNKPVTTALFTGGDDSEGLGCVADMIMYEQLRFTDLAVDLRRSDLKGFPAVVLTWTDLQSADGVTVPQGERGNRVGTRSTLYKSTYDLTIMVTRESEDHARRHAGLAIIDFISRLLTDRQAVDGICVSNPSGLQILQVFRETAIPQALFQKFYIYHVIVAAELGFEQIDNRTFEDWRRTVFDVVAPQTPALPDQGNFVVVDDMTIEMD